MHAGLCKHPRATRWLCSGQAASQLVATVLSKGGSPTWFHTDPGTLGAVCVLACVPVSLVTMQVHCTITWPTLSRCGVTEGRQSSCHNVNTGLRPHQSITSVSPTLAWLFTVDTSQRYPQGDWSVRYLEKDNSDSSNFYHSYC